MWKAVIETAFPQQQSPFAILVPPDTRKKNQKKIFFFTFSRRLRQAGTTPRSRAPFLASGPLLCINVLNYL
jgi:hypothetical protein